MKLARLMVVLMTLMMLPSCIITFSRPVYPIAGDEVIYYDHNIARVGYLEAVIYHTDCTEYRIKWRSGGGITIWDYTRDGSIYERLHRH